MWVSFISLQSKSECRAIPYTSSFIYLFLMSLLRRTPTSAMREMSGVGFNHVYQYLSHITIKLTYRFIWMLQTSPKLVWNAFWKRSRCANIPLSLVWHWGWAQPTLQTRLITIGISFLTWCSVSPKLIEDTVRYSKAILVKYRSAKKDQ